MSWILRPAYAYGKTAAAAGYGAAGVGVKIRRKARNEWLVLMPESCDGYVSSERFEAMPMACAEAPCREKPGFSHHGPGLACPGRAQGSLQL